jgi:hypothetical protein
MSQTLGLSESSEATATFTRQEIQTIVEAAVQVALDAFNTKLQSLQKALDDQKRQNEMLRSELEAAHNERLILNAEVNDLEQYSRRSHLRIRGLKMSNNTDCKAAVAEFLSNRLKQSRGRGLQVYREDIDAAHPLPTSTRPSLHDSHATDSEPSPQEAPPTIIVRFHDRELRDTVMAARRSLKSTGITLSDDLTAKNVKLMKSLKACPKIESVWSWQGKIYAKAKGTNKGKRYGINDTLPL